MNFMVSLQEKICPPLSGLESQFTLTGIFSSISTVFKKPAQERAPGVPSLCWSSCPRGVPPARTHSGGPRAFPYLSFKEFSPQPGVRGRHRSPQVSVPLPHHVSPPGGLDPGTQVFEMTDSGRQRQAFRNRARPGWGRVGPRSRREATSPRP